METLKLWINGEYYDGEPAEQVDVENPATGKVESKLNLA